MRNLEYWKYCLTIISLVFVSIQIQAQWTHITDLPTRRAAATACVINDKIYVIGGNDGAPNFNDLDANEVYDPSTNTWDTTLVPMPTPRGWLSSAVVDGIIYAIGGGYQTLTNNEAYDPLTDMWDITKADLLSPRRAAQAGVVDGIIYNIGGNYNSRDCEAYDPVTDTWDTTLKSIPGGGGDLALTVYNGLVYTFGGGYYTVGAFSNVYAYNPQTDSWDTSLAHMPTPRFGLQTYLVNGKIYAIGGSQSQNSALATVERYDPVTDTWDTLANMPNQLLWFAGAVVNNKIYVIGGTSDWATGGKEVWEYAPPISDVEQDFNLPTEFSLEQNYPNPFNPSTKISWQSPVSCWQTLKVFDVLGNEIATLVDEYKPTGTYELTWNAANLPSGVYFYQLRASSFVDTKKMILLK
jgi:N-acetylneuraminic acid mutarotase